MSSEQVHSLLAGVRGGTISRREFVRRAAILGMSGPMIAAFLAACGAAAAVAASSAPASADAGRASQRAIAPTATGGG